MEIIRLPAGVYAANCYIIYSESSGEGILVDPGGDADDILKIIEDKEINIKYILLTHGHGDHIGGVQDIREALKPIVGIHKEDKEMVENADINLSSQMPGKPVEFQPDIVLEDGDIIKFGELEAEIIHTPGHTRGSISIRVGSNLLTGDTLFNCSIGRTDLPGGDFDTIIGSIKNKLLVYPDDYIIYTGHGIPSKIGKEKRANPFLR